MDRYLDSLIVIRDNRFKWKTAMCDKHMTAAINLYLFYIASIACANSSSVSTK